MDVEAVIFDMDGTLLDSSRTVPAAYAAAIYELCGRRYADEEIIAAYSAGPASALIAQFIGRDAGDPEVECWLRHLEARMNDTVIYPGVRDALTRLQASGMRLGVFAGATKRAAELQLEHADLRSFFGSVVGSDQIGAVKPAPDGIHRACSELAVWPWKAAYVGDAINDLRCARAARAIPVGAGWGHLYESDRVPHLVANDLDELVEMMIAEPGRSI